MSDGFLSVLIQLGDFLSLVYTVHFHRWKLSGPGIGGGLAGLQSLRFRGCPGTFRHSTDVFLLAMHIASKISRREGDVRCVFDISKCKYAKMTAGLGAYSPH